jgi:hypothetical protein
MHHRGSGGCGLPVVPETVATIPGTRPHSSERSGRTANVPIQCEPADIDPNLQLLSNNPRGTTATQTENV